MFARWSQENFFLYMRQNYAFDKIIQYSIDELDQESKRVANIIKIICYRAETAIAALLSPHYKRTKDEIRMLVKAIINTPIDMEVDSENEELKITLYPMANQRSNEAVSKICQTINLTNTIYPGTNLRLTYKIATI